MGHLTPWSHVPHMLLTYGDDMTYLERVYNVIVSLYDWYYRNWVMLEQQNDIAHKHFAHLASQYFVPQIEQFINRNFRKKIN